MCRDQKQSQKQKQKEPEPEPRHGRTCHGQASQSLHKINKISDNTRAHTHSLSHTHTRTTISRGYFHQKRQKNPLKISSRPKKLALRTRIVVGMPRPSAPPSHPSIPFANHHSSTRCCYPVPPPFDALLRKLCAD